MSIGKYEGNRSGNGTGTTLAEYEGDGGEIIQVESSGVLSVAVQSEIAAQVATARRYPRSITRFMQDVGALATVTPEVARSCIYSVPRGGKPITGPSVRLAEIVASCYGNLRVVSRIVEEDTRFITAEATCLDVEKNSGVTVQVRRRITDKNGKTFGDDMIGVTGAAATSIARRNAIFAVVPNAFTRVAYDRCVQVASGGERSFAEVRQEWIEYFAKRKVGLDRVFRVLGIHGIDDLGAEHIEHLIGLTNAIREGDLTPDQAFPRIKVEGQPEPASPGQSKTSKLAGDLKPKKAPEPTPKPQANANPDAEDPDDFLDVPEDGEAAV